MERTVRVAVAAASPTPAGGAAGSPTPALGAPGGGRGGNPHAPLPGRVAPRPWLSMPSRHFQVVACAYRDGDVIAQGSTLGDDVAEGVDHHRAPVLQLVIVQPWHYTAYS